MKKTLLLDLLMVISFSACTMLAEDHFADPESELIVNSLMIAGEPLSVNLSLKANLSETAFTHVENAQIVVYEDGLMLDTLIYSSEGQYTSERTVQAGSLYAIRVLTNNQEIYKEQFIPTSENFTKVEHIEEATTDEEGVVKPALLFNITNQFPERSYFYLKVWKFTSEGKSEVFYIQMDDISIRNESTEIPLFSNELADSDTLQLRLNYDTGGASGFNGGWKTRLYPLIVELRTCNEAYFDFIKQDYFYELGRFPEVGSGNPVPVNPYDSFEEEGVSGVFAGYSVIQTDTIFPVGFTRF